MLKKASSRIVLKPSDLAEYNMVKENWTAQHNERQAANSAAKDTSEGKQNWAQKRHDRIGLKT